MRTTPSNRKGLRSETPLIVPIASDIEANPDVADKKKARGANPWCTCSAPLKFSVLGICIFFFMSSLPSDSRQTSISQSRPMKASKPLTDKVMEIAAASKPLADKVKEIADVFLQQYEDAREEDDENADKEEEPEPTADKKNDGKKKEKKSKNGSNERWQPLNYEMLDRKVELLVDSQVPNHIYRPCKSYDNEILYHEGWQAGLADRKAVIANMASLAQFLVRSLIKYTVCLVKPHSLTHFSFLVKYQCAKLTVASPESMLTVEHNAKKKLDSRLVWEDFYKFEPFYPTKNDEEKHIVQDHAFSQRSDYTYRFTYSGDDKFKITNVMDELIKISFDKKKTTFLWELDGNFYGSLRKEFKKYFKYLHKQSETSRKLPFVGDNAYVHAIRSDHIVQNAKTMVERLQNNFSMWGDMKIGTWHLRRGDSVDRCDTGLERMEKFVNCTFADLNKKVDSKSQVLVLVRTDETNPKYRKQLLGLFQPFENIYALDLDQWIAQKLEDKTGLDWPQWYDNNFHIFELQNEILDSLPLTFSLRHHRHYSCPDCEKIALE